MPKNKELWRGKERDAASTKLILNQLSSDRWARDAEG